MKFHSLESQLTPSSSFAITFKGLVRLFLFFFIHTFSCFLYFFLYTFVLFFLLPYIYIYFFFFIFSSLFFTFPLRFSFLLVVCYFFFVILYEFCLFYFSLHPLSLSCQLLISLLEGTKRGSSMILLAFVRLLINTTELLLTTLHRNIAWSLFICLSLKHLYYLLTPFPFSPFSSLTLNRLLKTRNNLNWIQEKKKKSATHYSSSFTLFPPSPTSHKYTHTLLNYYLMVIIILIITIVIN